MGRGLVADPDNGGAVKSQAYRIGDAFGSAGDDQVVYRCGGDPGALCGSGVSLRMQQVDGTWTVAEVLSSWIS